MTSELMTIIGAAIALAAVILPGQWAMRRDMHRAFDGVRRDIGGLRERMARLEGLFEGFTKTASGSQTQP